MVIPLSEDHYTRTTPELSYLKYTPSWLRFVNSYLQSAHATPIQCGSRLDTGRNILVDDEDSLTWWLFNASFIHGSNRTLNGGGTVSPVRRL